MKNRSEIHLGDKGLLILLAVLVMVILDSCMAKSTAPGPRAVGGVVSETSYLFFQWQAGLTVMIWDDIKGSHEYNGSSSTSDSTFKQSGYAESLDGRRYDYQLLTTDGKTAVFTIDGKEYDLSQGALFLITTKGGATTTRQLDHDLSGVLPTNEGCEAFARRNPDIVEFISTSEKD